MYLWKYNIEGIPHDDEILQKKMTSKLILCKITKYKHLIILLKVIHIFEIKWIWINVELLVNVPILIKLHSKSLIQEQS